MQIAADFLACLYERLASVSGVAQKECRRCSVTLTRPLEGGCGHPALERVMIMAEGEKAESVVVFAISDDANEDK